MNIISKLLLLTLMSVPAWAAVTSWDDALAALRGSNPPYTVVYVGHPQTQIMRLIGKGAVNLHGCQLVDITADQEITNPFTNRSIRGLDFIKFFSGVVQDYAAGTFFFLDKNGILIPHMILPHNLHKNRVQAVELYAAYATSGMDGKMSIVEFGILNGMKDIAQQISLEISGKKHASFAHMLKSYKKEDSFLVATGEKGQSVNPKTDAAIFVITKDPSGQAFLAQVYELWVKLNVHTASGSNPPPLVIIGPARASYPALDAMGVVYKTAVATEEALRDIATPQIMIPGTTERPAQAIIGFMPGEAIAASLGVEVQDHRQLSPDMPISEVDWPNGVAVQ